MSRPGPQHRPDRPRRGGTRDDLSAPLVPGARPRVPAPPATRPAPDDPERCWSAPLVPLRLPPVPVRSAPPPPPLEEGVLAEESQSLLGGRELVLEDRGPRAVLVEGGTAARTDQQAPEPRPLGARPVRARVPAVRGGRRRAWSGLALVGASAAAGILALRELRPPVAVELLTPVPDPFGTLYVHEPRVELRGRLERGAGPVVVHEQDVLLAELPVVDGLFGAVVDLPARSPEPGRRRLRLAGPGIEPRELDVVLDRSAPRIEWIAAPPAVGTERELSLRWSVDEEHLAEVLFDGRPVEAGTPAWHHAAELLLPENGTRTVRVEAVDRAGNRAVRELVLAHDSLAPRLVEGSPRGRVEVLPGQLVAVDWRMDEPVSAVLLEERPLEIEGQRCRGEFAAPSLPGLHVLRWSATDPAGNRRVGELELRVRPPVELELDWPDGVGFDARGSAYLRDPELVLAGRLEHARGRELVVRRGGEEWTRVPLAADGSFATVLDLGGAGRLVLELESEGLLERLELVVDLEDPRLEWLRPPRRTPEGLVLEWTASDAHLVAVRVDGREVPGDGQGNHALTVPLSGTGPVRVEAVDRSGRGQVLVVDPRGLAGAVPPADPGGGERDEPVREADAPPEPALDDGGARIAESPPASAPAPGSTLHARGPDDLLLEREPVAPGADPWGDAGAHVREHFLRLGGDLVLDLSSGTPRRYPGRIVDGRTGLAFRYVPGGSFRLGSLEGHDDERPERAVSVPGFYLSETEVSLGAWLRGGGEEPELPSWHGGEEHPVVNVDWPEADAWCRRLGLELPTEARWEWAAVGPEELAFPWGEEWLAGAASSGGEEDGWSHTAPVGSLPLDRSWCGVRDLAGNVSEWCADLYRPGYGHVPEGAVDPLTREGERDGAYVERGGSHADEEPTPSTYRFGYSPTGLESLGLRAMLRP